MLTCVEIDSSFYRPHRAETYARWRDSVPNTFRFSVKIPKAITHDARLVNCEPLLDAFLESATELGSTLGCWLVQLPPSLVSDPDAVRSFSTSMRERTDILIALEARPGSWFAKDAATLLKSKKIAYVDADPQPDDCFITHRADTSLVYFRLHGSPEMYQSSYEYPYLDALTLTLHDRAKKRTKYGASSTTPPPATPSSTRCPSGRTPLLECRKWLGARLIAGALALSSAAAFAQTAPAPAENTNSNATPVGDRTFLLTIFLKQDQSKTLPKINKQLKEQGFFKAFPPTGVQVVSWYVMMGIGQVVTLRVPADKYRVGRLPDRVLSDLRLQGNRRTDASTEQQVAGRFLSPQKTRIVADAGFFFWGNTGLPKKLALPCNSG